eukprot:jgi/Botrbrau1/13356/Bobra.0158s0010.2
MTNGIRPQKQCTSVIENYSRMSVPSCPALNASGRDRADSYNRTASELLCHIQEIFKSFNPVQSTIGNHTDIYFEGRAFADGDQLFISEVFEGMHRYHELVRTVTERLYRLRGKLLLAVPPHKALPFLQVIFNPTSWSEEFRPVWLQLYDSKHVEEMLEGLRGNLPEAEKLMQKLEGTLSSIRSRAEAEAAGYKGGAARTTIPQPFKLTPLRPKPSPVEESVPSPPKFQPPPARREGPTAEEKGLKAAKAQNREAIKAKYSDPKCQPFSLRVLQRPMNLDKLKRQQEEELAAEMSKRPPPGRVVPRPPNAEVRLNAAAILREESLFRKKQRQEAAIIQRYEAELRDAADFQEWRQLRIAEDEAQQQCLIKQRRDDAARAADAAAAAQARRQKENVQLGLSTKEESQDANRQIQLQRQALREANAVVRDSVVKARARVAESASAVTEQRRETAAEVRAAEAARAREVAQTRAREEAERRDIIMQLKALEKVPKRRNRIFDPTAAAGLGLLEEMSLFELHERLQVVKARCTEERAARKAKILEEKNEWQEMLVQKAATIGRVRRLAHQHASDRRSARDTESRKRSEELERRSALEDTALLEKFERKAIAKSRQQEQIQQHLDKVAARQAQQAQGARKVEQQHFKSLRAGARRSTINRIKAHRTQAEQREHVRSREQAVRRHASEARLLSSKDFIKAYDEKVKKLLLAKQAESEATMKKNVEMYGSQRRAELRLHEARLRKAYVPKFGHLTTTARKLAALASGCDV